MPQTLKCGSVDTMSLLQEFLRRVATENDVVAANGDYNASSSGSRDRGIVLGKLCAGRGCFAAQRVVRSDPRTLCGIQQGLCRCVSKTSRQKCRDQAVA